MVNYGTKPVINPSLHKLILTIPLVVGCWYITCGGLPARTCPSVARPSSNLEEKSFTFFSLSKKIAPFINLANKRSTNRKTWTVSVLLLQARKAPQGENEREKMEAVLFKPRRSSYSFAPSWHEKTLLSQNSAWGKWKVKKNFKVVLIFSKNIIITTTYDQYSITYNHQCKITMDLDYDQY